MNPHLTTAPGRLGLDISGARFADYATDGPVPGFTALYAGGDRCVSRLDASTGRCAWIGHGNVNEVAFGQTGGGRRPAGLIETGDLLARRGSQSAGFRHACHWVTPAGERLLSAACTVRIAPGPSAGVLLDLSIVLTPCTQTAVALGRSGQGPLSVRVAAPLLPDGGGQLRNSNDEFGPEEIHGRQAAWCACNGVVDGETVGMAILDHPDNPWHPTPWVCTNDGLLSPSPFPWRSHTFAPRELLSLRYRIVLHSGYVEAGWVTRACGIGLPLRGERVSG